VKDRSVAPQQSDVRTLARVSWVVQGQGALLSLLCIGFGLYALGRHRLHHGLAQTEFLFALGLLGGVVLVVAGRAIGRAARGAYSPLLLLELICLPVSWGLAQGQLWVYSAIVGLSALLVLAGLASPAGRRVVTDEEPDPDR
jgi:hypothetical protein